VTPLVAKLTPVCAPRQHPQPHTGPLHMAPDCAERRPSLSYASKRRPGSGCRSRVPGQPSCCDAAHRPPEAPAAHHVGRAVAAAADFTASHPALVEQ
jgi:hypothetical protein